MEAPHFPQPVENFSEPSSMLTPLPSSKTVSLIVIGLLLKQRSTLAYVWMQAKLDGISCYLVVLFLFPIETTAYFIKELVKSVKKHMVH